MNKYILFCLLILSSCSANPVEDKKTIQDKLFDKDGKMVLEEISAMTRTDQDIRALATYGSSDRDFIDSIRRDHSAKGINIDSLRDYGIFLTSTYLIDSLSHAIPVLNRKHTERVVELIEKYGYPTSERLRDSSLRISPTLLIQHADTSYSEKLLALLKDELENDRINDQTFGILKWHLNGRVGIPDVKGITIVRMDKETGKADTVAKP